MNFDRKYLVWALGYAVVGMCVGIYMAASHIHTQYIAHAHILLVGFVVSLAYGIIHKLWLVGVSRGIATTQIILHQAGAVAMLSGLLLLYGNVVPEATLEPILAVSSVTVLVGALLMFYMVLKAGAVKTLR